MVLPEAVDKATDDCIRDEILKDILLKNRAEVKNSEGGDLEYILKARCQHLIAE